MTFSALQRPLRLAIVGCGDVARRAYLDGLAAVRGDATVAAVCDLDISRAQAIAELLHPRPAVVSNVTEVAQLGVDAALNLTTPPSHYEISAFLLRSGLSVYSEKPLARTREECDALLGLAAESGSLLMCAPAIMATARFRWLKCATHSGQLGRLTLATAQIANLGPAAWRPYTGDPAGFYQEGVGPVVDQGVYILHAVTGLLGPARRVQALSTVAIPQRTIAGGARAGATFAVGTADHVLMQLECGDGGALAQILSSYAVPATRAPTLELHGTLGSLSLSDPFPMHSTGPVSTFLIDPSPAGLEGWIDGVMPQIPVDGPDDLVGSGPQHFVNVMRGRSEPLLTAQHAAHVLDIALAAEEAAQTGQTVDIASTFDYGGGRP